MRIGNDYARPARRLGRPLLFAMLLILLSGSGGCSLFQDNKLQTVKRAGELVVLTRNSPTTYYVGPDGPTGIEYDMAKAFADRLGVKLKIVTPPRFSEILPMLAREQADLAAAGLTVTELRQKQVRFAPPYQEIRQQLVHHMNTPAPADIKGLVGRQLQVVAGTSYAEHLNQLRLLYPELTWTTIEDVDAEELMHQIQQGLLEFTIADSNIIAVNRQFYPELQVAFDIKEPENLAWAFPRSDDDSLYDEAAEFFKELRKSGKLAQLLERYYGAASRFNPINISAYLGKIDTLLPVYRTLFEDAAKETGLDWRLLAAMAYQESFWDAKAASPTGVRGIMMLTEPTAASLGVTDLLDPAQSIGGGARYLRQIIDQLPERIPEPDRTWMALAAYNIGINHLGDARVITRNQKGDADKWKDVQERLPLLAKEAWYTGTTYGYARGYEAVQFVNRIRTYYDTLRKKDEEESGKKKSQALKFKAPAM
jgi:membrane-bound lytic murein transglycosylase F